MDEPGNSSSEDTPDSNPVIPHFFEGNQNLARLRRMGTIEAQLARAKLGSEGIRCFIADENMNVIHPLIFNAVELQVAQSDVDRANEILDRPAEVHAEGEYADEEYRCPRCHRKAVDLVPLSKGPRTVRAGCLTLLVFPFLLGIIESVLLEPKLSAKIEDWMRPLWIPWILLVVVLGFTVLWTKRKKSCRACGLVWSQGETSLKQK